MAVLELQYLYELRRVSFPASEIIGNLARTVGLVVSDAPWNHVVAVAAGLSWTRDPFDRLIVANALAAGCRLVTADERIRQHCQAAIFD
jgi:PIN domain nuclease of toxin-antitoxin system